MYAKSYPTRTQTSVQDRDTLIDIYLFIYLFIINFVKRQGCTEDKPTIVLPTHIHTLNNKKLHAWTKQNNTKTINLKTHKKIHMYQKRK